MNKLRKYGIILTTIMTIFTSSLIVAKAAGTQATIHTLYKTNTLGNAYEYVVISVEFADYTSGTIIISVENLAFYDYIVLGARLSNVYSSGNTRRLTLQVDDCKQVIVYCLPHAGSMVAISPSIYNNSTSYVEHVNQSFIEEQFTTTNGYIDDLESTCSSIYTDVHNIYLQLVDQALDLDNIQSQLTRIGNYLNTTNTSLTTLNNSLSLIMQQIQNIDYQIDTISWNVINSTPYGWTTDFTTINTDMTTLTSSSAYPYILLNYNTKLNEEGLYKISLNYDSVNNFNDLNLYLYSNGSFFEIPIIYHTWERYHLNLYFNLQETALGYSSPYYWCIKIKKGQAFTSGSLSYIKQTDIEYWQLIQAINNYNYQKEQLNVTQELIDIVSQLNSSNSTETTTNITNFNTNMEIINDIENDLSINFNGTNTLFKMNNEENWNFDTDLQPQVTALNSVFNATITNFYPTKTWLAIIMLCAVILAILG